MRPSLCLDLDAEAHDDDEAGDDCRHQAGERDAALHLPIEPWAVRSLSRAPVYLIRDYPYKTYRAV